MSSDGGSSWCLVDLVDDLVEDSTADAGQEHTGQEHTRKTRHRQSRVTQTNFAIEGAAAYCSPPSFIDLLAKFYVVWSPKHLSGVYIGAFAWGVITKALGGPYHYGRGHRLCRRDSLGTALATYRSEAAQHDVPPEPIFFDCQFGFHDSRCK